MVVVTGLTVLLIDSWHSQSAHLLPYIEVSISAFNLGFLHLFKCNSSTSVLPSILIFVADQRLLTKSPVPVGYFGIPGMRAMISYSLEMLL